MGFEGTEGAVLETMGVCRKCDGEKYAAHDAGCPFKGT